MRQLGLASLALVLLSGCMVGPNYSRPSVPMAPAFKKAPPASFKEDDVDDVPNHAQSVWGSYLTVPAPIVSRGQPDFYYIGLTTGSMLLAVES